MLLLCKILASSDSVDGQYNFITWTQLSTTHTALIVANLVTIKGGRSWAWWIHNRSRTEYFEVQWQWVYSESSNCKFKSMLEMSFLMNMVCYKCNLEGFKLRLTLQLMHTCVLWNCWSRELFQSAWNECSVYHNVYLFIIHVVPIIILSCALRETDWKGIYIYIYTMHEPKHEVGHQLLVY